MMEFLITNLKEKNIILESFFRNLGKQMHTLLIFAITIFSSTIFAADVPPRLGNIPKAQSHESGLTRKKTETLLPTRASDADIPVVPVVTRTRSPKVHAKRRPKASSSADSTPPLAKNKASFQRSTSMKSPQSVRFSEVTETVYFEASSPTQSSKEKRQFTARQQAFSAEIDRALKELQENPQLYVAFKKAIVNRTKARLETLDDHERIMSPSYRIWQKHLYDDYTYITKWKLVALQEQGSYLLAEYTSSAIIHEPLHGAAFANKYGEGWVFTIVNEDGKCPTLPSWDECVTLCSLKTDETLGMHPSAVGPYMAKDGARQMGHDPAETVRKLFRGNVEKFHWRMHSIMPPCIPRLLCTYAIMHDKDHSLVMTCKSFYDYYLYWKQFRKKI